MVDLVLPVAAHNIHIGIARDGYQQNVAVARTHNRVNQRIGSANLMLSLVDAQQQYGEWLLLSFVNVHRLRLTAFHRLIRVLKLLLDGVLHEPVKPGHRNGFPVDISNGQYKN
ncbi:hypothetical protein D3C78_1528760 [compost metagenome]